MNELPDCMYDYREELSYRYERNDEPEIAGACVECGETMYSDEEYYLFKTECVCEKCKDEYIEQFKVKPTF